MDKLSEQIDEDLENKQMIQNCVFIKTNLMLLVVLGHSVNFWRGDWFTGNPLIPSMGLTFLSKWVNSFHVYAFTLVSGYLFAYKMSAGGYVRYCAFFKNKALVPYVFSALVWVVPISQYFFKWNRTTLFGKYVLCESPSQLWFLWMLFDIFIIAWPLWKWLSGNVMKGIGISVVLYCIGVFGYKLMPNLFCIWIACQYMIFFFIGIQIKTYHCKGTGRTKEICCWSWLIIYIFVFSLDMLIEQNIKIRGVSAVSKLITHIVGALMAYTTLDNLARYVKWEKNNLFVKLSKYSMPIYLFHEQFIYILVILFNGRVNPWINAVINFGGAVIGSFTISRLFMRSKIMRFLIGEK